MGSSANSDYCAFTKAVQHLGDRWSLLIVRELFVFGPQGFNSLATGLPGRISRSVLADKLRKLEELGLVARAGGAPGRATDYRLTPAGEQLKPAMMALWQWADRWVPEDPGMAERDPDVIAWWLTNRVDATRAPTRQVVIDLDIRGPRSKRCWLVLQNGVEASLCIEDPQLGEERYVYVEAGADALLPIARGVREWSEAIGDGSVRVYGEPELVRSLPAWFRPAGEPIAGPRIVGTPAVA